ncbi:hypothetical protein Golob_013098 [Gossypium lobatum]|uniref:Uncharacterized protein n=1 Tax=Gossypium lobatum TaxID=34289 RepID=A0A7J8LNT0_9ROSI|nr:hypothetical protein [Gossypium lobatum]
MTGSVTVVPILSLLPSLFTESLGLMDWEDIVFLFYAAACFLEFLISFPFLQAESAIAALNCSGAVLGSLPIRVSPSKTPIRPRALLPAMN